MNESQRDEARAAALTLVNTVRNSIRKDPWHYNPWNYADDFVREIVEEVMFGLRESQRHGK